MRRNLLDNQTAVWRAAQLVNQIREHKKARSGERAPAFGDHHEGIGRCRIGPAGQQ
jgi:hypothetical protein